jgi:hypothetical protein
LLRTPAICRFCIFLVSQADERQDSPKALVSGLKSTAAERALVAQNIQDNVRRPEIAPPMASVLVFAGDSRFCFCPRNFS